MDKQPDIKIGSAPTVRPKNAATLLLLDLEGDVPAVLMGRRSRKLAFMPGLYVFPGGRTDRSDHAAPRTGNLQESDLVRLTRSFGARGTRSKAEAIALSAIRETWEETGLMIAAPDDSHGSVASGADWTAFGDAGVAPDLSALRYVARAITPPGQVRRFNTRFFAAKRSSVANPGGLHTNAEDEIEDVCWVPLPEVTDLPVHPITTIMLETVTKRLASDPDLTRDAEIPCTFYRYGRFHRVME
ncbi:NUDIX hydrolase [Oricola cellulosilytica]|uniref:NUDIX domain-containing protein n=1 Tax=Oricola cellulosilytica TaxID=1429082 RepID=A0A4R0PE56_9HYPH|nr:NUDIX domain-containing protein [Oricola cellulosilytica]TCD14475.1 NUDIX domain-containing protein [Oricola cellulosilytica]